MKRAGSDGCSQEELESVEVVSMDLEPGSSDQLGHDHHHHHHQVYHHHQASHSHVFHGGGNPQGENAGDVLPLVRSPEKRKISSASSSSGQDRGTCSRCSAQLYQDEDEQVEEEAVEEQDRGRRVHKRERVELGRSFQQAVSAHSWDLAESYIQRADTQRLNDGLCIALDSVWFLSTQEELSGATRLIEKIIRAGANDYTRATLRTSFLASCVSACRSRTMSLADTVTVMAQRLRDRLQECNGDEELKAEAAAKVQRFTEWALRCIGSHSRGKATQGDEYNKIIQNSMHESRLQLMAFKHFLGLAGGNLSGKDYTEAFDAACFPLTLFSSAIDPGWATGIAASAMQGLLGLLLEGGADNVNQCFLEAARFGSTELVRILLQIAQRNSVELDVDLALGFASHYCKLGTMECLVHEGSATSFLGPLMRAAERGSLEVVEWFVTRGCKDMELCLALTAAASSSRIDAAAYLLDHVPAHVLDTLSGEILKAAGERSAGSLKGIAFLLHADFLGNPDETYRVADAIATAAEEEGVTLELRDFLAEEWSLAAFAAGRQIGARHHVNFMRALKRGSSPLSLQDLPLQLQATVAYLPLYKECVSSAGVLLSQRLRGQLVEAVSRLKVAVSGGGGGGGLEGEEEVAKWSKRALIRALERRLPPAFVRR
ncbi:ankyrin repeat protein SKIP35 [Selaginella moellendorffii]|nr:ankyrin repeat protein SKIP35 [Selaginella moellendorffii]XP_024517847.1 ankyrin repeat protein SKIP35 [Selaginella moellendorffii]XP_024517854.1 ankyrin repeat protein SKIP35 [Selaginella moellendorffii]|eukprot:XP_002962852.2 ankyrin repeat protein SKIP35 [Selaginella moellendorffii]